MARFRIGSSNQFQVSDCSIAISDSDYVLRVNSDGSINISTENTDGGNINVVIQATDENGNHVPISVVGADQDELKTADLDSRDLLESVVEELKIMNLHLLTITNMSLNKEDVEV